MHALAAASIQAITAEAVSFLAVPGVTVKDLFTPGFQQVSPYGEASGACTSWMATRIPSMSARSFSHVAGAHMQVPVKASGSD